MVGQVKDQGSDIEQKVESLKGRQVGEKQHNKGLDSRVLRVMQISIWKQVCLSKYSFLRLIFFKKTDLGVTEF